MGCHLHQRPCYRAAHSWDRKEKARRPARQSSGLPAVADNSGAAAAQLSSRVPRPAGHPARRHTVAIVSALFPLDAPGPLSPVYPFNEPGQPIVLYDGPLGGLAATDVAGVGGTVVRSEAGPGVEGRAGSAAAVREQTHRDAAAAPPRRGRKVPAGYAGPRRVVKRRPIGRADVPLSGSSRTGSISLTGMARSD